jgi:cobalt-zinc-cadmium efflux system outer membrane protein
LTHEIPGGFRMKPESLMAWLLLTLAALGCRLVLAADVQNTPSKTHRPEEAPAFSTMHWGPQGAPPLVQLFVREPGTIEPEAIQPEASRPVQQLPSPAALTLDDLERMALQSNPTLVQAGMAVRAAQGGYIQAGLCPNPTIGYAGADMGIEGTSGQQGAVFSQEIVTSGKLRYGRAVAGFEVQQARYGWEMQRWRVLNDVRASYYQTLLAQRMIEVNRQLVRIAEEGLKATEQLKAAEEVGQVDVLQARVEAEVSSLSLYEALNRHQAAWRQLAGLVGRPEMGPAPLAGDIDAELPEFDWEDTLTRLWAQSPELAQARVGVRRARSELALQYAERVPNIEFEMGAKYDATTEESLTDVGIGLPLPLFNRNQGNIVRAQAELISAQREVQRVELELRDRLVAAFEKYTNARQKVESYKNIICPNAQKSLKMISDHYPDEFGYLTLLTSQRTFFSVSLKYLANLREMWAQTVELEGMLLGGGLQRPE